MIKEFTKTDAVIEVNEYIERFGEIKPHLDMVLERITLEEIKVINDGCDEWLLRKIVGYIENHDVRVRWT